MSPFAWLRKHHHRIRDIGIGLAIYEAFNFVYDWIFYPFALVYWGYVWGSVIVVSGSLIINAFVFWLYDYMRVDWLGAHAFRQLEEKENQSNLEKLATWLGKRKRTMGEKIASPLVFIALTLPIDPVIVAIHFKREHFKGLNWMDWALLFGATLAANLWWLVKVDAVIVVAQLILRALF